MRLSRSCINQGSREPSSSAQPAKGHVVTPALRAGSGLRSPRGRSGTAARLPPDVTTVPLRHVVAGIHRTTGPFSGRPAHVRNCTSARPSHDHVTFAKLHPGAIEVAYLSGRQCENRTRNLAVNNACSPIELTVVEPSNTCATTDAFRCRSRNTPPRTRKGARSCRRRPSAIPNNVAACAVRDGARLSSRKPEPANNCPTRGGQARSLANNDLEPRQDHSRRDIPPNMATHGSCWTLLGVSDDESADGTAAVHRPCNRRRLSICVERNV